MSLQPATITLVQTVLVALGTLVPVLIAAWTKIQEVMRPILARKLARVTFLVDSRCQIPVAPFIAGLRAAGWKEVTVTNTPTGISSGVRATVVWHSDPTATVAVVNALRAQNPEQFIVVMTHATIPGLPRSEQVLLVNSQLRLRGDLNQIAEMA